MAMIHKFREADLTETFPELNASPNILVMTDEAHRSQYCHARGQPRQGHPQLRPHRLHRHAHRQDRAGLRRLHRQIHDAPVHRGRRDAGDRLRRPHPQRRSARQGGHGHRVCRMCSATTTFRSGWQILGYGSRDAYLEAETDHRGQGQGHGGALPDPCLSERLQGADRRHLPRGRRALQEAHRCSALADGYRRAGKGQSAEARSRPAQEAEDGRHHLRQPQRPAAPQGSTRTSQSTRPASRASSCPSAARTKASPATWAS